MSLKEIINEINNGKIVYLENEIQIKNLKWNKAAFDGVYLKHLVKGESTENKFSCHLVKIEAGCEIGEHIHEGKWELHEVLDGEGTGFLDKKEMKYGLGISAVIPADIKHKVVAGKEDLYLFAKFIPALL